MSMPFTDLWWLVWCEHAHTDKPKLVMLGKTAFKILSMIYDFSYNPVYRNKVFRNLCFTAVNYESCCRLL